MEAFPSIPIAKHMSPGGLWKSNFQQSQLTMLSLSPPGLTLSVSDQVQMAE